MSVTCVVSSSIFEWPPCADQDAWHPVYKFNSRKQPDYYHGLHLVSLQCFLSPLHLSFCYHNVVWTLLSSRECGCEK